MLILACAIAVSHESASLKGEVIESGLPMFGRRLRFSRAARMTARAADAAGQIASFVVLMHHDESR